MGLSGWDEDRDGIKRYNTRELAFEHFGKRSDEQAAIPVWDGLNAISAGLTLLGWGGMIFPPVVLGVMG